MQEGDAKAAEKGHNERSSRKPYAASAKTRERIIASAAESFMSKGFQGATLRGIARDAKVDHSTLIHHFKNKEYLLNEVLRWRDEAYRSPELDVDSTLAEVVEGFVEVARRGQRDPQTSRLFSVMSAEAAREDHPAREYLRERHTVLVSFFAAVIEGRRGMGKVRNTGRTPTEEAVLIVSLWEGLEVYERLHPGQVDVPDQLRQTLRESFGLTETGGEEKVLDYLPSSKGEGGP